MTNEDIAWFAGFFEGEGCVRLGSLFNRNGRRYGSPVVDICQVNKEPLDRCRALFPDSKMYGPYQYSSNKQPHFKFTVLGRENVEKMYFLIKKHLSTKRKKQFEKSFSDHSDMIAERAGIQKKKRTISKAICHPDKRVVGRGMCHLCYSSWYNKNMRKNEK